MNAIDNYHWHVVFCVVMGAIALVIIAMLLHDAMLHMRKPFQLFKRKPRFRAKPGVMHLRLVQSKTKEDDHARQNDNNRGSGL